VNEKFLLPFRILFCALTGVLLFGCSKPAAEPGKETPAVEKSSAEKSAGDESKVKRNAAGEAVLALDPETQRRIALKVEAVAAATHSPEVFALGSVLDPAPLVTTQGELASAEAAVAASKKTAGRAQKLFEQGENISRKAMEASEAELRINEIKLQTALLQLNSEWGDAISKMDSGARQKFISELAGHQTALARVELAASENISGTPQAARVQRLGEDRFVDATIFSVATKVDPKTQGQGFVLQINLPDPSLRPGAAVKAALQTAGEPLKGVLIPRSAVLRAEGKTWVYLQTENNFTRREVELQIPTEQGWFTTASLKPGDQMVVEGAQILLSEEQKAQIKAD